MEQGVYQGIVEYLVDKVITAIKALTRNKWPGCDNIPIEHIKSSESAKEAITTLCQQIWKTRKWLKDWTRSMFIPIPKKEDTTDCSSY